MLPRAMDVERLLWDLRTSGPVSQSVKMPKLSSRFKIALFAPREIYFGHKGCHVACLCPELRRFRQLFLYLIGTLYHLSLGEVRDNNKCPQRAYGGRDTSSHTSLSLLKGPVCLFVILT